MESKFKIFIIFAVIIAFFGSFVYGENIVDYSIDPDICRFSDHDSSSTLPFVRFSAGKTEVDSEVNKAGICFSNEEINVTSDMSDIQILFSTYDIKISSSVEHALTFSQKSFVSGNINGTSAMFAAAVDLNEKSVVNGNLLIFAGEVNIKGEVNGNVIVFADKVNIDESANIKGSVRSTSSSIDISENATISGLVYAKYDEEAIVPSNLKDFVKTIKEEGDYDYDSTKTIPILTIVLSSLIVAAIYVLLSAKTKLFVKASEKLKGATAKVIISGLVTIFAMPIIFILSLILWVLGLNVVVVPVIVILLALIILAAVLRVYVLGTIISEYMLKTSYAKYFDSNLKKFILAAIIYIILSLLEFIPVVGGYIGYLYVVIAVGLAVTFTVLYKTLKNKVEE